MGNKSDTAIKAVVNFRAGAQDGQLAPASLGLLQNVAASGGLVLAAGARAGAEASAGGTGRAGRSGGACSG